MSNIFTPKEDVQFISPFGPTMGYFKMPQEMVDQRNEYYRDKARAQEKAVDNNLMRQNDPRMPLFSDKKSTTTKGKR